MTLSYTHILIRGLLIASITNFTISALADDRAEPSNPNAAVPAIIYNNPYDNFRAANEEQRSWKSTFSESHQVTTDTQGDHLAVNDPPYNHSSAKTAKAEPPTNLSYDGEGTVVSMPANNSNSNIKLKHGAIKKLDMPAMTMTYKVADPVLLKAIHVGDRIDFDINEQDGGYVITAIVRREP